MARWKILVVLFALMLVAGVGGAWAQWRKWQELGRQYAAESSSFCDAAAVETTKLRAREVIDALEKYKSERGTYPSRLADLMPTYLKTIPIPTAGRPEFDYQYENGKYELTFGVGKEMYPCYYYVSATGKWVEDD